jgi:hypothetical protein
MTLDIDVRSDVGVAMLAVTVEDEDGTIVPVAADIPIGPGAQPTRLLLGWDPISRRLTVGRPGATPDISQPSRLTAVTAVRLSATGRTSISSGPLRHGGPRANAHTPLRDLLIGPITSLRARWRDLAGQSRLVESGDLPVWQAQQPETRIERVGTLFVASAADAPVVVVSFAARVTDDGCTSVDLLDASGRGVSFRVEPAGESGGSLVRLGWRERIVSASGEVADGAGGDSVPIDARVASAGEPVRVTFEWDRSSGAIVAQAERSPAHRLEATGTGGVVERLWIGLDKPGDSVGAITLGTVPADALDVRRFDAAGDGIGDDGPAVRRALAESRSGPVRRSVYLPPGVYRIAPSSARDLIEIRGGDHLIGAGHGSVLVAAHRDRSAVRLSGSAPTLSRMRLLTADPKSRSSDPTRAAVNLLQTAVGAIVADSELGPTEETALIALGTALPLVIGNRVNGTLSDGLHFTHGSRSVRVAGNLVRRTHDDAIALVSYRRWAGRPIDPVRDADIVDNDVGRNRLWGRGITVVGGTDVRIRRNRIVDTNAAGLLLAAEAHYDTAGVSRVVVEDNVIERPRVGTVPHAGVLLWADAGASWRRIEDVVLRRNTVDAAGWRGWTIGCGSRDVDMEANSIRGSDSLPLLITGTAGRIRIIGNEVHGGAGTVVLATATDTHCPEGASGWLEFDGNVIVRSAADDAACSPNATLNIIGPVDRSWTGITVSGTRFVHGSSGCAQPPYALTSSLPIRSDACEPRDARPSESLQFPHGAGPVRCMVPQR